MATTKRWENDDGWCEEYFEPLLNAQARLDKIGYEIRNCVRLTDPEDIISEIESLEETLKDMREHMEEDQEEV